jgi:hypothetical protein
MSQIEEREFTILYGTPKPCVLTVCTLHNIRIGKYSSATALKSGRYKALIILVPASLLETHWKIEIPNC